MASVAKINPAQVRKASGGFFGTWDRGNRSVRHGLLREFIAAHAGKSAPQLERELNMSGCLLLSRIVAWLQVLRGSKDSLLLLLDGLAVFLGAPGGSETFVNEAFQMGALQSLLEIVRSPKAKDADRFAAIKCLRHCISAGLKYQIQLCQMHAISAVGECLANCSQVETQSVARDILELLPVRNEAYLHQVYAAFVQILRAQSFQARYYSAMALTNLQRQMSEAPSPSIVEPLLSMLECGSVHVHNEVFNLFDVLLEHAVMRQPVVIGLLRSMHLKPAEVDNILAPASEFSAKHSKVEASLPLRIKQATSANFIYRIFENYDATNERDQAVLGIVEEEYTGEYLLHAFGNLDFHDSRKQAATAVKKLLSIGCMQVQDVVHNVLGEDYIDTIMTCSDLDELCHGIKPVQAETMKSALVLLVYNGKV